MKPTTALSALALILTTNAQSGFYIPGGLPLSIYSELGIPTAPAAFSSVSHKLATNPAAESTFLSRAVHILSSYAAANPTDPALSSVAASVAAVQSYQDARLAMTTEPTGTAASAMAASATGSGNAAPTNHAVLGLSGAVVAGLVGAAALL